MFRSITYLTMGEGFLPVTMEGRLYLSGLAICCIVLGSAYTANLAAFFTSKRVTPPPINSIGDFQSAAFRRAC